MSKITWKGSTLLGPVPPTMVSCGTVEEPNVLCVAWTGICNSNPPMTYVSIRPERYSHELIKANGEFVINLTPSRMVRICDYVGVKSGRDENKFEKCKLTAIPCTHISAPQIEECPVSLECKVKEIKELGSHDMFLAEIVGVNVDEKLLDEDGKLHMEQAGLASYIHGEYFAQGKKVGSFGYSVRKRPNPKKKSPAKKKNKKQQQKSRANARLFIFLEISKARNRLSCKPCREFSERNAKPCQHRSDNIVQDKPCQP